MDSKTKMIDSEEFQNLGDIIKIFYELTCDKIKEAKMFNNYFSNFIDLKKGRNKKDIIVKANPEKIGRMLKCSEGKNKIKTCLGYSPSEDMRNFNILFIAYNELSKINNLGPADNIADILRILEKCYELRDSKVSSVILKNLADNFIISVSNLLTENKIHLMNLVNEIEFMQKNFKGILNSISKNRVISLSDDKSFYVLLAKHYFAADADEKGEELGERCNLSQIVKEDIEVYNNGILESKDPVNKESNRFFNYLMSNTFCELDYQLFTLYNDKNFLQVIKKVREKLVNEDMKDEIPEKIAILDMYMVTFFKKYTDDTNIPSKVKK